MATSRTNKETTQATGKMKPCHRPSRNPGASGLTASGACWAAHAVSASVSARVVKRFIGFFPVVTGRQALPEELAAAHRLALLDAREPTAPHLDVQPQAGEGEARARPEKIEMKV